MTVSKIAMTMGLALLTAACAGPLCQTRNMCRTVVSDTTVQGAPVLFDFDSATLTSAGREALMPHIQYMLDNPETTAKIEGYTDSMGSEAYNLGLSERRANSAKKFFVEKGVACKRLTTAGMGETNFIADNATKQGRAQNRRIEIEFK